MDGLAYDDLDEFGRELDDPFEELVQDVVHIALEAFGSNPDDLTRGVGLAGKLSGPASSNPGTKAQFESQLHDDERVTDATCSITATDTRGSYRIDLTIQVNAAVISGGGQLSLAFLTDGAGGIRRLA